MTAGSNVEALDAAALDTAASGPLCKGSPSAPALRWRRAATSRARSRTCGSRSRSPRSSRARPPFRPPPARPRSAVRECPVSASWRRGRGSHGRRQGAGSAASCPGPRRRPRPPSTDRQPMNDASTPIENGGSGAPSRASGSSVLHRDADPAARAARGDVRDLFVLPRSSTTSPIRRRRTAAAPAAAHRMAQSHRGHLCRGSRRRTCKASPRRWPTSICRRKTSSP